MPYLGKSPDPEIQQQSAPISSIGSALLAATSQSAACTILDAANQTENDAAMMGMQTIIDDLVISVSNNAATANTNNTNTNTRIDDLKISGFPGELKRFLSSTPPSGTRWLLLSGQNQTVSIATGSPYASLAFLWCGSGNNSAGLSDFLYRCTNPANTSATRSNTGDYLVLPPAGYFSRPLNTGTGKNSGQSPYKLQAQDIQSHTHRTPEVGSYAGSGGGYDSGSGTPTYTLPTEATGGTETRPDSFGYYEYIVY